MSVTTKLDLLQRPRRIRRTAGIRALVAETVVTTDDLVAPLFVVDGKAAPEEIGSMPGVYRLNVADLAKECRALHKLGVRAVALFPKLDKSLKTPHGAEALNPDTLVLRAIRAVKKAVPELLVVADLALDPYTTHGHDGVLTPDGSDVDNDTTVAALAEMAVLHAEAGTGIVAPSDMMDGRVGAIRRALDAADHTGTAILANAADRDGVRIESLEEARVLLIAGRPLGEVRRQAREILRPVLQARVHRAHQHPVADHGGAQVQRREQVGVGRGFDGGRRHAGDGYACVWKGARCRESRGHASARMCGGGSWCVGDVGQFGG